MLITGNFFSLPLFSCLFSLFLSSSSLFPLLMTSWQGGELCVSSLLRVTGRLRERQRNLHRKRQRRRMLTRHARRLIRYTSLFLFHLTLFVSSPPLPCPLLLPLPILFSLAEVRNLNSGGAVTLSVPVSEELVPAVGLHTLGNKVWFCDYSM